MHSTLITECYPASPLVSGEIYLRQKNTWTILLSSVSSDTYVTAVVVASVLGVEVGAALVGRFLSAMEPTLGMMTPSLIIIMFEYHEHVDVSCK